ncbi:hypothetical protein ACJJTC_018973 [Scirpophaga incertulas]
MAANLIDDIWSSSMSWLGKYSERQENSLKNERKTNLEIKNVPLKGEEKKTDLIAMIKKLTDEIGMQMKTSDIKDIIKTKNKNQQNSTLIVEFTNTFIKNELQKCVKLYNIKYKYNKLSAKHLGIKSDSDTPIFIAENLTPKAARLYYLARDCKAAHNYKHCWTSYGRVYLRADDVSPIITITNESQILGLMNK